MRSCCRRLGDSTCPDRLAHRECGEPDLSGQLQARNAHERADRLRTEGQALQASTQRGGPGHQQIDLLPYVASTWRTLARVDPNPGLITFPCPAELGRLGVAEWVADVRRGNPGRCFSGGHVGRTSMAEVFGRSGVGERAGGAHPSLRAGVGFRPSSSAWPIVSAW
jgi:hypothetical protein